MSQQLFNLDRLKWKKNSNFSFSFPFYSRAVGACFFKYIYIHFFPHESEVAPEQNLNK